MLADWRTAEEFTAAERAALELADAMTEGHVEVTQDLFNRVREHFDEPDLVELTSAIAWENYRARFNRVFDVGPEGFSEGAYCPLPLSPRP